MSEEAEVGHNQYPLTSYGLPPELARFLDTQRLACVAEATNLGTAYIIKAPTEEIESVRGPVLIHLMHELHRRPSAPVLRTLISLHDRPNSSLKLETFTNLEDESQRANFDALRDQQQVFLLFYDEALTHRLSKQVALRFPHLIDDLIVQALRHRAAIPNGLFDFDTAKAEVLHATSL